MKRMVSLEGLTKEEWLLHRKKGITGTDAGAIVGLDPYKSAFAVYQDKVSDEITDSDNEAMRQGRDLEEYVARRFVEETGLKVRRANAIFQNEEHPFMLADFDRLIVGQKAGLECKTVSPYSSDKWKDGEIPVHYQMQVQHYLAVSGFSCWYIAAVIFGREFIVRRIDRDEEIIHLLVTIEQRFWEDHVMKRVMPEPDGTDSCSEQISKLYGKADMRKSIQLCGFDSMLQRREELVGLIGKMEKEKSVIEQKIKVEMQDAAYGLTKDFRVSWTDFESRRLDTKKLKEENLEIYQKYCRHTNNRRFVVTAA